MGLFDFLFKKPNAPIETEVVETVKEESFSEKIRTLKPKIITPPNTINDCRLSRDDIFDIKLTDDRLYDVSFDFDMFGNEVSFSLSNDNYIEVFWKGSKIGKLNPGSYYEQMISKNFSNNYPIFSIIKEIDFVEENSPIIESIILSVCLYKNYEKEFETLLNSIPLYNIVLSHNKPAVKPLFELDDIKYSSITSKTKRESLSSFIVIDTETTGLDYGSEIIELSALKFINNKPVELFTTLLKPKKKIPAKATEINNITDRMVENSPAFCEIMNSFQEFIHGFNIVGHNLPFDIKMLHPYGLDLQNEKRKYYDTLALSKKWLRCQKKKWDKELRYYYDDFESDYDVENYQLDTICEYFDIFRNTSHRSSSDCLATGLMFIKLLRTKFNKIDLNL